MICRTESSRFEPFLKECVRGLKVAPVNTTTTPITSVTTAAKPEFADHHGARALFALSRTSLYRLEAAGKIKSICVRQRGAQRGRRLFDCDSIRHFLREHMEGGEK